MTQQQLAVHMGLTVTTVSRWETFRPPGGLSLGQLAKVAYEFGRPDLEAIFRKALFTEMDLTAWMLVPGANEPLSKAVRNIVEALNGIAPKRLVIAYRKMVSAIRAAHDELVKNAVDIPPTLPTQKELEALQVLLDRIDENEQRLTTNKSY
jgi:transcriptional regulator with XRE-family HTH domain